MNEISVTLPDGDSRRVSAGSTPADVAALISPGLAKAALAAVVDDRLVDLTLPLERDARVVRREATKTLDRRRRRKWKDAVRCLHTPMTHRKW